MGLLLSGLVLESNKENLNNLREYATIVEELLENRIKKFLVESKEKIAKFTKKEQEEFYEFHSDVYWELSQLYPNILRNSLFVTCFSLFEHELISLCKYLWRANKYSLKLKDIADKSIVQAGTYLQKVVGVKFPKDLVLWQDVAVYQIIRNCIIHNDGRIHKDHPKIKQVTSYINRSPSIELDNHRTIQFSAKFCFEFIDRSEGFFDALFTALKRQKITW